jgi:TolA-binding protein
LQTELDTVQEEHEQKLRELSEALKRLTHMSNLREQATCKNVALEKVVVRFEQRNVELEKKVQQHEDTVKGLTKELNTTKGQLKVSHNSKQMLEKRCTKLQDECEELRNKLKCNIDLEKVSRRNENDNRLDV